MSQRLREITQGLAGGSDLLGVQAEVVGVGEQLLKSEAGVVETACTGQAFDEPKGADVEGALEGTFEGIRGGILDVVATDEGVVGQLLFYAGERGEPTRVGGTHELYERHEE